MGGQGNSSGSSSGIGLLGGLFLVFLVLRLLGKISWSWWWVTAPLWGGFALLIAIPIGLLAAWWVAGLIDRRDRRVR